VKLGDFGYSHEYAETVSAAVAGTFCGTPVYLAPELWRNKRYSKKADIWSLGVILYEMLALKRPYFSPYMKDLMEKILKEDYAPPPPHYSEGAIELCQYILNKDHSVRPSIQQIVQMDYVRKGLDQLIDIVKRNVLIDNTVKACLTKHVGQVLAATEPEKVPPSEGIRHEGQAFRATDSMRVKWETCFLQLDKRELRVYLKEGGEPVEVYKTADVTNTCPVGPQEAGVSNPNVWAIFFSCEPHTVWFRCQTEEMMQQWLEHLLVALGDDE